MADSRAWLADLLRETGEAHHAAFIDTDGADPEWPIWYAGYLQDRLGQKLDRQITRSELVRLLVLAEREHGAEAPAEPWPRRVRFRYGMVRFAGGHGSRGPHGPVHSRPATVSRS